MIIDCFTFLDEFELLEIRLAELSPVVDVFVLVEAAVTYSGKSKPCLFAANRDRFRGARIVHLSLETYPPTLSTSALREEYSRNALRYVVDALNPAPGDLVMLSDVDEIPRAESVRRCADLLTRGNADLFTFQQQLSCYYFNLLCDARWEGTRMVRYEDLTTMTALRNREGAVALNGGWHFSYLAGPERISRKISSSIHTELDIPQINNPDHIERCIREGIDLFGRNLNYRTVPLDSTFPRYVVECQARFQYLIREERPEQAALEIYVEAIRYPTDIGEHLPYLRKLASTVRHITELGMREGASTSAFILGGAARIVSYDINRGKNLERLQEAARAVGIDFEFHEEDVLDVNIEETDLLFIDTQHIEEQMRAELYRHAHKARRYLVMHDTETFGETGDLPGRRGIWYAIAEYMRDHPEWRLLQHFPNNNGLTVFTRIKPEPATRKGRA